MNKELQVGSWTSQNLCNVVDKIRKTSLGCFCIQNRKLLSYFCYLDLSKKWFDLNGSAAKNFSSVVLYLHKAVSLMNVLESVMQVRNCVVIDM